MKFRLLTIVKTFDSIKMESAPMPGTIELL